MDGWMDGLDVSHCCALLLPRLDQFLGTTTFHCHIEQLQCILMDSSFSASIILIINLQFCIILGGWHVVGYFHLTKSSTFWEISQFTFFL